MIYKPLLLEPAPNFATFVTALARQPCACPFSTSRCPFSSFSATARARWHTLHSATGTGVRPAIARRDVVSVVLAARPVPPPGLGTVVQPPAVDLAQRARSSMISFEPLGVKRWPPYAGVHSVVALTAAALFRGVPARGG